MEYGKPLSVCAPAIRGRQRWSPARFPGAYPGGPGSSSVVNHDSRTEANLGRSSLRISVCSGLPACQASEGLLVVAGVWSKLGRRERIADSMDERARDASVKSLVAARQRNEQDLTDLGCSSRDGRLNLRRLRY